MRYLQPVISRAWDGPSSAKSPAAGRLPVVTGGTGFYLRALIEGLAPGPQRDENLRAGLQAREAKRPGCIHRLLPQNRSRSPPRAFIPTICRK